MTEVSSLSSFFADAFVFINVGYTVPIYDGTVPFTAGGREGKFGFDFSQEHLSALHRVPQLDGLRYNDFVVVGATVTDYGDEEYRVVEFNTSFVMKIGHGD